MAKIRDAGTTGTGPADENKTKNGKFESRRIELAQAALATLGRVGYAGASLREIAQKTEFSHGVFHYYFKSRDDLIACAMREYKTHCATRYDEVVMTSKDQGELVSGFAQKMFETLQKDHDAHRLWYDLRAQAMFNPDLQPDVLEIDSLLEAMVWRVVDRYFTLAGQTPSATPQQAYALFDGMFQRLLLGWLNNGQPTSDKLLRPVIRDSIRLLG